MNWRFLKIAYKEWFNHWITLKHIKAFAVNIEQINKPNQKSRQWNESWKLIQWKRRCGYKRESCCTGDVCYSDGSSVLGCAEGLKEAEKQRLNWRYSRQLCLGMKGSDGRSWAAPCHFLVRGPPWQRTNCNWSGKKSRIECENSYQHLKILFVLQSRASGISDYCIRI